METRKLILYVALGVIIFILWQAWQKDHATQQTAAVPLKTSQKLTTSQGLPHLSNKPIKTVLPAVRLVHVKTDTLHITIDTLGGSIVNGGLPEYPATLKDPKRPIQILSNHPKKFYVAQSGLMGIQDKPLQYRSVKKSYVLQGEQKQLQVNLTWKGKGFSVIKTFIFRPKSYVVNVSYQVKNSTRKSWNGKFYTQIQRLKPPKTSSFFGIHTYNGAAISSHKKPYEKVTYSKLAEQNIDRDILGGWVAMQQRYFLTAWVPAQHKMHHYYSNVGDGDIYTIGMVTPIGVLTPGQIANVRSKLYVGPELTENLKPLAKGLDLTIDYGWLWFISIVIFWVMKYINAFVGNWGWTIVIVTLIIRLLFYKLSETGFRSMAKMRALGPKMQALKDKYGDNKQELSKATMELYKKEKVNPISGCLPQLVQIPVLFALYYVLIEAVQLRQAPFILWIHDLSVRDPYYILPVLMGISMFLSQKLMPSSPDPTQAKMMLFLPVLFTGLFTMFPAGLVLYWLVNNILVVLQQWHIMRKYEKKPT